MYTLIAYRKEKENWLCGYDVSSRLTRFDNLSEEECISMIVDLSIEIPEKPDMRFEEFHVIPIVWTNKISNFSERIKTEAEEIVRKETEERRKKFLELQKEFATTT